MKQICSGTDTELCDDSVTALFSGAKLALENRFIGIFIAVLLVLILILQLDINELK